MKKIFWFVIIVLLVGGCSNSTGDTSKVVDDNQSRGQKIHDDETYTFFVKLDADMPDFELKLPKVFFSSEAAFGIQVETGNNNSASVDFLYYETTKEGIDCGGTIFRVLVFERSNPDIYGDVLKETDAFTYTFWTWTMEAEENESASFSELYNEKFVELMPSIKNSITVSD